MLDQAAIISKAVELGKESTFVDVVKLANQINIDVYVVNNSNTLDDFHAKIVYDSDTNRHKIYVNGTQPIERQRFSIAHELAHFVLHKDKLDKQGYINRDGHPVENKREEDAADQLAAKILMPKQLVESELSNLEIARTSPITKEIVLDLADKFRVSKAVSAIRLRTLKYFVPFYSFA